jgi:hypothetical protein
MHGGQRAGQWYRGYGFGRVDRLHPPRRPVAGKKRAAARPFRQGRPRRRQDHQYRPQGAQADAVDQGVRGGRGKTGDGRVWLVRFGRQLGAAIRRAEGADATTTEGEEPAPPAADATPEDAETETAKPDDQDAAAAPETAADTKAAAEAKAEVEDTGEEAKTAPKKSARKSPAKKPAAKKSPAKKPAAKKAAAKKDDGKVSDDAKKGAGKAKAKKDAKDDSGS